MANGTPGFDPTTRFTMDLLSKVNLPCAINFKALCCANVVILPADT